MVSPVSLYEVRIVLDTALRGECHGRIVPRYCREGTHFSEQETESEIEQESERANRAAGST
jgi:hypothetical protein